MCCKAKKKNLKLRQINPDNQICSSNCFIPIRQVFFNLWNIKYYQFLTISISQLFIALKSHKKALNHLSRYHSKVSALMPELHCSVYGIALNFPLHLPFRRMSDFCSEFFTKDRWYCCWLYNLHISVLPISRPSMFSFLPLICCHTLMIKNISSHF